MTMKLTGKKEFFANLEDVSRPFFNLMVHLFYWTEGLVKEELIGPEVHVQSFVSDDSEGGIFALCVFGMTEDVVGMNLDISFDDEGYPDIDCEWEKGLGNDFTTMTRMGISVANAEKQIAQFICTYIDDKPMCDETKEMA